MTIFLSQVLKFIQEKMERRKKKRKKEPQLPQPTISQQTPRLDSTLKLPNNQLTMEPV
jgi:hypothetical protein